jgi:hypothetical protein
VLVEHVKNVRKGRDVRYNLDCDLEVSVFKENFKMLNLLESMNFRQIEIKDKTVVLCFNG